MDPGAVGPPVPADALDRAERLLAFGLPPLLKRLYAELGDGGFGPGYGCFPLLEDESGHSSESAVGLYRSLRQRDPEDPAWDWPTGLVPLNDWGCAIRSCIDCTRPDGPISVFDPAAHEPGDPVEKALLPTHGSVADFLRDWIADVDIWGQMFEPDEGQPTSMRSPLSGKEVRSIRWRLRNR